MPGLGWAEGGSPQGRAEVSEEPRIMAGLRGAEGGPAPGWAEGSPQGTWRGLKDTLWAILKTAEVPT